MNLAGFPGPPRLHTIDLEFLNQNTHHRLTKLNCLKYKAIALNRNSHSVSIKPSVTQADQFRPSEPNPLLPVQRHLGSSD